MESGSARSKQNMESAMTPEEIALAIDHIRETIFSPLDKTTILNCRSVCLRWHYSVSKQLQKTTTFKFTEERWWMDEDEDEETSLQNIQHPKFVFNRDCRHTVRDLTNLLDNSIVANTEFPCTAFEFNCAGKISPVLESFFQNHGPQLKKLEFFRDTNSLYFHGLKNILIHATNLEYFSHHPGVRSSVVSPRNNSEDQEEDAVKEYSNAGGEETAKVQLAKFPSKSDLIPNPNPNLLLLNLKVVKFTHEISRSIFQEFVDTSPNLTEVSLVTENLEYFLKPVNRLHLLKTLKMEVKADNIKTLESLASAIHTLNNGKSAIEYLDLWFPLDLEEISAMRGRFVPLLDIWGRVGKLYTQILAGSSASCRRLKWYPFRYFSGFQTPTPVMPMGNVTTLELFYSTQSDIWGLPTWKPTQFFHGTMILADTFPNLKCVSIQSERSCFGVPITHLFDDFNLRPVLTVTRVASALVRFGNYLECFKDMFPNAVITEGLRLT